jgi:hypothetical protein
MRWTDSIVQYPSYAVFARECSFPAVREDSKNPAKKRRNEGIAPPGTKKNRIQSSTNSTR